MQDFNGVKFQADTNTDLLKVTDGAGTRLWPYTVISEDRGFITVVLAESKERAITQIKSMTANRDSFLAYRIGLRVQGWGDLSTENF